MHDTVVMQYSNAYYCGTTIQYLILLWYYNTVPYTVQYCCCTSIQYCILPWCQNSVLHPTYPTTLWYCNGILLCNAVVLENPTIRYCLILSREETGGEPRGTRPTLISAQLAVDHGSATLNQARGAGSAHQGGVADRNRSLLADQSISSRKG